MEGTWISPASLFSLLWTFFITFSVILAPEYYFSPLALLYILSILLTYFVGNKLYYLLPSNFFIPLFSRQNNYLLINQKFLLIYILFACVAAFSSIVLLISGSGFNVKDIFSMESYITIASGLSEKRYAGESEPFGTVILLGIGFSGNLAGGLLFAFSKNKLYKIFSTLSLIPVLIYTIIYTTRAAFLFGAIFFISSYLSAIVFLKKDNTVIFTLKNMLFLISGCIFVFVLFIGTQLARMEVRELSISETVRIFNHIKSSFVGNISPFSIWFDLTDFKQPASFGAYSLAGLFEKLGISRRDIGVFAESFDVSNSFNYTNIFSLFRVIIEDFSFIGSYLFFLFFGFFSNWIYHQVKSGNLIFIAVLSPIFAFLLWSFIVSIFAYNTIIFAFLLFGIIVLFV